MFDSLADQIKHDEHLQVSTSERMVRWFAVTIFSVLIFGGVYMAVRLLE